jgi:hypothetical protein
MLSSEALQSAAKGSLMPAGKFSHRRYIVEIATPGDGATPILTVDGESVPLNIVNGGFAVAYLPPFEDLHMAARAYVDRLARKGGA